MWFLFLCFFTAEEITSGATDDVIGVIFYQTVHVSYYKKDAMLFGNVYTTDAFIKPLFILKFLTFLYCKRPL